MEWLEGLLRVGGWLRDRWRSWRFGAKAELDVHWTTAPVFVPGVPSTYWREIGALVTAAKHEEFVVSEGVAFVRAPSKRDWAPLYTLAEHGYIRLPLEVKPNRQESFRLSAKKTAERLREVLGEHEGPVEIRVELRDFHGSKVTSSTLTVEPADLEREELRN